MIKTEIVPMNAELAREVLAILAKADGSCPYCVAALFIRFDAMWPQHREIARELWDQLFPKQKDFLEFTSWDQCR